MAIKKIAVRGGHNTQATGASDLINEVTEDRLVTKYLIVWLRQLGFEVLEVTPGPCDANTDLAYGVNKANAWGADLFISIHFNSVKRVSYSIGSEVCVYSSFPEAVRVAKNLADIGFKNADNKQRRASTQGLLINPSLYELSNTTMSAMIVETCFVNSAGDVKTYKSLGPEAVAKAMAEGIANKKISSVNKEEYDMNKLVVYLGDVDLFGAVMVSQKYGCPLMKYSDYKTSGLKVKEVIQIGGKATDTNRYVTFKNAAALV